MATSTPTWDPEAHVVRVGASQTDRTLSRLLTWGLTAIGVLLTVVFAVGSVLLEGGFAWQSLLPLAGVGVVWGIRSSNDARDDQVRTEIGPAGITWQDASTPSTTVSWDELGRLRRTRRYIQIAFNGSVDSTLTHGLSLEADDGWVWHLPEVSDRDHYLQLVRVAQRHGVVPPGIELVGLDPGDVPADVVPPRDEELPRQPD